MVLLIWDLAYQVLLMLSRLRHPKLLYLVWFSKVFYSARKKKKKKRKKKKKKKKIERLKNSSREQNLGIALLFTIHAFFWDNVIHNHTFVSSLNTSLSYFINPLFHHWLCHGCLEKKKKSYGSFLQLDHCCTRKERSLN